ncbi:MAG: hypothetical protein CMM32_12325 [Rhodospirillaceae bacterium]|nr:hypothetical protein [Rhodospirillaceae bacterium]
MVSVSSDIEALVDIVFLVVTGLIAYNGVRYRDAQGNSDFVRLLFGCIAAMFFFLILFRDVLELFSFM